MELVASSVGIGYELYQDDESFKHGVYIISANSIIDGMILFLVF